MVDALYEHKLSVEEAFVHLEPVNLVAKLNFDSYFFNEIVFNKTSAG